MSCDHGAFVRSRAGRLRRAMQLTNRFLAASGFPAFALATILWLGGVQAQETHIIYPGSMAVTGFSGTVIRDFEEVLPPGVDRVDETFIDTTRATLRVFDVSRLGGPATGQLVFTRPPFEVTAGQIGQVFAITYDDGVRDGAPSGIANLFAGATSLHGVRIVTSDEEADGRPKRQSRGAAGATFMNGQFGTENGGGPGTIWKIDGITGQVSKFADLDTNSGPGIGDVTFDTIRRQFFASDLDTGLIHRIDANGALIDKFDHGVAGRPAHGLAPLADDGLGMDIEGAAFDSEDPDSWGYTQDERRVWSVAYHGGRLYYSVGEKAELWSVGVARDGSFAGDPRWELTVKADKDHAVTDIAFDISGFMYLAQRGLVENRYDYSRFADTGTGEVFRYWRENPGDPATESIWVGMPQDYAVGFPHDNRQSAGGLDLQYGYDTGGNLDASVCTDTLVKTGDKLRDNPELAEQLAGGGPLAVHGVQITPTALVKPANVPPFGAWLVDFDGYFEEPEVEGPEVEGHVGDVEVWHPCEGRAGYYEQIPGPPVEKKVDLILKPRARTPVCTADGVCTFVIDIINNGSVLYDGPLTVTDTYPGGAPASSSFGPIPPWTCGPSGPGQFRCDNAGIVLSPGASTPIFVKAMMPAGYRPNTVENCAEVKSIPGENDLTNNRACAKQRIRHSDSGKPAMRITKMCSGALAGAAAVTCRITVISTGTSSPTGPVRINDAATLVAGGRPVQIQTVTPDGAEWTCGPVPANALSCQIPGAVMTPGTSRHFDVALAANAVFENCARGSYGPAPGDDVVYPIGRACAQGGGASTIRVEKTGDAECRIGQLCSFEITIANDGQNAFSGPVRIGDAIGVEGLGRLEGVAITSIDPPLGCAPEPATLPASCIANLTLGAGESHVHRMAVVIPDDGRLSDLQGTVSGQNCVGVLSPDTPVRGAGKMPSQDPANVQGDRGKAYACHPFNIKNELKKACSQGLVMNGAGQCVCPEGTTFRNGQCSSGGGRVIIPKPKERCVLLKGQIRTSDGRCVCPRGTELEDRRCVSSDEPPARLCKLLPGQIRTKSGDCVCPRRTELRGRACVPIVKQPTVEQCTIRGQVHNTRGACVCPRGTEVIRGACRRAQAECAPGSRLINGRCQPIIKRRCPVGTVGQYPDCTPFRRAPTLQINPNLLLNPNILQQPRRRPRSLQ
ncbi:hypothetical protein [Mesorhizobium sp.]|uniref:hypothetical protein n=2 Tax=Mesorhizobium sp. TaxID=1871066 RepID=UPI000FE898C9|nr:MAG: hypothetical protein EOR46_14575 [Mesorhizobium sp.]RWK67404.1 MAG: hypothetical protein EOR54_19030 [Mesorhizobium sp.]RWK75157.1 MAG: hypothetical protein EOR50_17995 [Mesorhizobium sp.]RWK83442.1 MAG: hypothetical protein EOR51_07290 [Mesorhizobium sp.]RWL00070.1 MAG: hypothetical protein EOR55_30390 [Mesorhizobium sp.]